jgi:hypothetical protein
MIFLLCYAFIQLTILRFFGHSIDHDIVDHSIGQATLNHSMELIHMLVLTRSQAKNLVINNTLSEVPYQPSSRPDLYIIPSSISTAKNLSSFLVLRPIDSQGSLLNHGENCSFSNSCHFPISKFQIWNFQCHP